MTDTQKNMLQKYDKDSLSLTHKTNTSRKRGTDSS